MNKSRLIRTILFALFLSSSLVLGIADKALNENGHLDHALSFLNVSNGRVSDSDLNNIKIRTINELNNVSAIRASSDGQIIQGVKSGNSYMRSPIIMFIVGEWQIDEIQNIGLINGSITAQNNGIEYFNSSYNMSYARRVIDYSKFKFNLIKDNNLTSQEFRMIIVDNNIYLKVDTNWMCVYINDTIKKKINDSISPAKETREALIGRINSTKKLIFEGVDEVDQDTCIKLALSPDLRSILISLPEDQVKNFITLIGSGAEFKINDSIWISTKSFLPKKEFYELTIIMPRNSFREVADLVQVNMTNNYDFNKSISFKEIIIPDEAKEVACIEPNEAGLTSGLEIRGEVFNLDSSQVQWTTRNFGGFYYDIDKNIGNEQITFRLSDVDPGNATLSDKPDTSNNRGIVYTTKAQPKNFKFKPWGRYEVIGFLSTRYFAAYDNTITKGMIDANESVAALFDKSKNRNLMANQQITKVLVDDNKEITITTGNPLKLGEGYELAFRSIDANETQLHIDLKKDGKIVDSRILKISANNTRISDRTYYYTRDLGETKDIVTIAIHFKNIFRDSDIQIATVDGEFQISDNATPIRLDQQYDKMSIRNVNPTDYTINMDNKDNQVIMSKNKDVVLMQNIYIKTADQDNINADTPLRFYIYKKYTEPGTYQLRGSRADLGKDVFTWDNSAFSGFYYDIDKNLGTEQLTFRLTNKNSTYATLSDQEVNGSRGIVYTTVAQNTDFEFKPWGQYKIIGFLGDRYLAAYTNTVTQGMKDANESVAILYDISRNRNLMTNEQISKILMDDNKEIAMTIDSPLKLREGYQLAIKKVDIKGDKAYVELSKNGEVVDSKVVQPSIQNAKMSDKTYYYKVDVGGIKEIVQIAVHFKNITRSAGKDILIVDGIFQISDSPISLIADQQYAKLFVNEVDPIALTIKMDNKYWKIILRKNKDTLLMGNISIKTADQIEISDADPLRYYIYKTEIIKPSA